LCAIEEDCIRLLRLANNLLDLARMEAGHISMEKEPVEVQVLVESALGNFSFQAGEKGISLISRVPEGLSRILVDLNKAIWVITNLIGNALRYTGRGGEIVVKASEKGNRVFLSVHDTGIGIHPAYHEKIFEKFQQVPGRAGNSGTGGSGLGLAIAREIVEAHGGRIWVESEPGRGSTFTCSFPIYRD